MKILAIGAGAGEFVKGIYEEQKPQIDAVDLKPRNFQKDYDVLVAFNVLTKISYIEVMNHTKMWMDSLKAGGEMLVLFPSLEWAARQILFTEKPSPALCAHLYGTQSREDEFYKAGYTLLQARDIFQTVGLQVTHAKTGLYDISGFEAEMHTIRGIKPLQPRPSPSVTQGKKRRRQ